VLDAYQHQYIGGILTIASTDNETLTFGIILKTFLIFFYYVKRNKMLAAQPLTSYTVGLASILFSHIFAAEGTTCTVYGT
jgi:hypothetical protein